MAVDTRKVPGRRLLSLESLDELLAEADRLARIDVEMLGNWSLGQVFQHLAIGINGSIDGFSFSLSFPEIWVVRLFMKQRLLTRAIRPGYGRSRKWDSVKPGETSVVEGLTALRAAVARLDTETKRSPHPAMRTLTADEWNLFHLRHAELHMSFALPKTCPTAEPGAVI